MANKYKDFDWNIAGLTFGNWDEEKLWALDIPVTQIDVNDLLWHLDCPWWTNDLGEKYSVTPREMIDRAAGTDNEFKKIETADASYPIHIFFTNGKWLILDGIHRFVKLYMRGGQKITVKVVTTEMLPQIITGEPVEFPVSTNALFDLWSPQKKEIHAHEPEVFFAEGDVFNARLGMNIGYEQDGKGDEFLRPVLVLSKLSQTTMLVVPLTTNVQSHRYRVSVGNIKGKANYAILSQVRVIDARRLAYGMGIIAKKILKEVKQSIIKEVVRQ